MVHLSKTMKYGDLLKIYPQLKPVLRKYGIPIAGCGMRHLLSMNLEQLAQYYSVESDALIKALQRGT